MESQSIVKPVNSGDRERPFRWSSIKSQYDNRPRAHSGTLEDFYRWIKGPGERQRGGTKNGLGLVAATFIAKAHDNPEKNPGVHPWRLLKCVEAVHHLMIDIDDARDDSGAPMPRQSLEAPWQGYTHVTWSTYSHGRPGRGTNARIVLSLARPITDLEEHDALYTWMMATMSLAGLDIFDMLDAQCADATRLMFCPRDINRDSSPAEHWCELHRGDLLDPDQLPGGWSVARLRPVIELLRYLEPRRGDGKPRQHLAVALARVISGRVAIESLEAERDAREADMQARLEALQAARSAAKTGSRDDGTLAIDGLSGALLRVCGIKGARTALERASSEIGRAGAGSRHELLLSWGKTLGGWIAATYVDDDGVSQDLDPFGAQDIGRSLYPSVDVESELLAAARLAYGKEYGKSNASKTIRDALGYGQGMPFRLDGTDLVTASRRSKSAATTAAFLQLGNARRDKQASWAEKRGAVVRICQSPFFSVDDIRADAGHRFVFMRGVQGTGKTTAIAGLIKALDPDRPVIYISLRVSLCADASRRLGLESYKQIKGEIELAQHPRLAICADSLHRIAPWSGDTKPALIILDESEQLARHIFGGTIAGSRQTTSLRVFDILRALIDHADLTLAADADLDLGSLELCRGERGTPKDCSRELWVVHPRAPERSVLMARRHTDLLADLFGYLPTASDPVAVQCTSCKEATRLAKMLAGETVAPGLDDEIADMHSRLKQQGRTLRVLLITQDTTSSAEVSAWLEDNAQHKGAHDVIISSPTLATGVSVDWTVSRVYGLATWVRGYTSEDFAQQLWRYRQITDKTWRVWVQQRFDDLPERWSDVDELGRAGSRTVDRLGSLMRPRVIEGRLERTPADCAHWSLYCTVTARQNQLSAYMYGAWLRLCVERGYRVEDLEQLDDGTRSRIDGHRARAAEIIREEHIEDVFGAERWPWKKAESVFARGANTPQERHAAERALIAYSLSQSVQQAHARMQKTDVAEHLDGWRKKGRAAALHMVIALAFTPGEQQETARAAIASMGEYAANNGLWEEREGAGKPVTDALAIAKLLEVACVDPYCESAYTLEGAISQSSLERTDLVAWIERHHDRLRRVITLKADWRDKLVRVVSDALRRMGFRLKGQQVRTQDGDEKTRVRVYHIDTGSRALVDKWSKAPLERHLQAGQRHLEAVAAEALSHHSDVNAEGLSHHSENQINRDVEGVTSLADISYTNAGDVTPEQIIDGVRELVLADPIADPPLGVVIGELAEQFKLACSVVRRAIDRLRLSGETDCDLIERLSFGLHAT